MKIRIKDSQGNWPEGKPAYSADEIQGLKQWLLDNVYKVGKTWESRDPTSPAEILGGVWAPLEAGTFTTAAGEGYPAGSTGGAASVVLTVAQIPSHRHLLDNAILGNSGSSNYFAGAASPSSSYGTQSTGGGQPHENRPPYKAYYKWERTA